MSSSLTRITVDAVGGRAAEMARALAARGFTVHVERHRFVAESAAVEAQDAEVYLRSAGFAGGEFRIHSKFRRIQRAP